VRSCYELRAARGVTVPRVRLVFASLVALAALAFAAPALAHAMGVSRGEYRVTRDGVDASLVFREDEIENALGVADREAAARTLVASLDIARGGARCTGALEGVAFDPPDGVRVTARFSCPPGTTLDVRAGFLTRLASGHAHVASVQDASGARPDQLLVLASPTLHVDLAAAPESGFLSFLREGIFHILTGPDHLLFLFGLVLFRRDAHTNRERVRGLVLVLTAFTVGHSISLAVATLFGIAPPSRVVEPLVALSVAWVGAENIFSKRDLGRRWMITFPFGLVHGFAFASGLLIVHLPRAELPRALVGFNLGVEAGQLGVMALVLPLLFWTAQRAIYDRARIAASALIVVAGLGWFMQRVFFS